jgi:hypothetical protein
LATGLFHTKRETKTFSTESTPIWAIFIAFFQKDNLYKLIDKL